MGDNTDPRRRCLRCGHIERPKYPMRRHVIALSALVVPGTAAKILSETDAGPAIVVLTFVFSTIVLLVWATQQGQVCRKCESKQLARLSPQDSIAASAGQAPPQ